MWNATKEYYSPMFLSVLIFLLCLPISLPSKDGFLAAMQFSLVFPNPFLTISSKPNPDGIFTFCTYNQQHNNERNALLQPLQTIHIPLCLEPRRQLVAHSLIETFTPMNHASAGGIHDSQLPLRAETPWWELQQPSQPTSSQLNRKNILTHENPTPAGHWGFSKFSFLAGSGHIPFNPKPAHSNSLACFIVLTIYWHTPI